MVSYFPSPLPDEIFYSILARYGQHCNISIRQIGLNLFGSTTFTSHFHMPNNLANVVLRIDQAYKIDVDSFISDHTLYPFLSAFGSRERSLRMYQFLAKGGERFVLNRIAGLELGVYKYCTLCAKDDRATYGEAYWHRVHNLPSVICCTKHKCLLKEYPAKIYSPKWNTFIPADAVIETEEFVERANESDVSEDLVVEEILLKNEVLDFSEVLQISKAKGLIRYSGNKVYPIINDQLRSYVEKKHPRFADFVTSANLDYRLPTILRGYSDGTQPWLNILIKEFVETQEIPFDQINVVCPNKVCKNYNSVLSRNCWEVVNENSQGDITYVAKCSECEIKFKGYTQRPGRYLFLDFGEKSIKEIRELYGSGKSQRFIQRKYGIGREFLRKIVVNKVVEKKVRNRRPINLKLRTEYRKMWLDALKSGNYKTLNDLIKVMAKVQCWLYRHDREWIVVVNSKYLVHKPNRNKVKDYEQIDKEVLIQLNEFIFNLDKENLPRRLTKSLITSNLKGVKGSDLKNLPNTRQAILAFVESKASYSKRIIRNYVDRNVITGGLSRAQLYKEFLKPIRKSTYYKDSLLYPVLH